MCVLLNRTRTQIVKRLLLIFFLPLGMFGQNLVPNGGFEPDDCNLPAWDLNDISPPWDVNEKFGYWQEMLITNFSPCSSETNSLGLQPRTGDGALGFPVYGWPASTDDAHESRGYPISPLTQTLTRGITYQISYWVKAVYRQGNMERGTNAPGVLFLSDTSSIAPNELNVLESNDAIYPPDPITDYANWTQVCMQYTAKGNEKFIILGNFRSNANTETSYLNPSSPPTETVWRWSYYSIDDLVIIPHTPLPPALPESAKICPDDEITLETYDKRPGMWDDGSTGSTRTVTSPGTYTFSYYDGACYQTDVTIVNLVNCEECHIYLPNAFSPNGDGLNDIWKPQFACEALEYQLLIVDRMGNVVFKSNNPNEGWNPIDDSGLGTYVARIQLIYDLYGERTRVEKSTEIVLLK
ncbi:MAG: gliding motility-associated C-terminal domain-containing protein [Bacteroidetes bacterium]|nr:MAG: gliding motility-associated C-terminal domain-containing protein [Bacteroidota bacterium]